MVQRWISNVAIWTHPTTVSYSQANGNTIRRHINTAQCHRCFRLRRPSSGRISSGRRWTAATTGRLFRSVIIVNIVHTRRDVCDPQGGGGGSVVCVKRATDRTGGGGGGGGRVVINNTGVFYFGRRRRSTCFRYFYAARQINLGASRPPSGKVSWHVRRRRPPGTAARAISGACACVRRR